MGLALGVDMIQLEANWTAQFNPSLSLGPIASALGSWHNAWDDALSDTHSSNGANHRWPALAGLWLTLYNPSNAKYGQPAPLGSQFPDLAILRYMRDRGITPFLFVQPAASNWSSWDDWNSGQHDGWIRDLARAARDFAAEDDAIGLDIAGRPKSSQIVVRFAHEMNEGWPPWATGKNGNTPAGYRAAFARFHDIARDIAPNLTFHYCPGALTAYEIFLVDDAIPQHYPGPGKCEYVGLDWYSNDGTGWASAGDAFQAAVNHYRNEFGINEPLIIGETGISQDMPAYISAAPRSAMKARAGWINGVGIDPAFGDQSGFNWIADNLPEIEAIVWFQASTRYEIDIATDNLVRTAMANVVNANRDRLILPTQTTKFSGTLDVSIGGDLSGQKILRRDLAWDRQQAIYSARALTGALTLCPRPTTDSVEYAAAKAAALAMSTGSTAHFETIRDSKSRIIRIRMGRTGGAGGDYLTVWRARTPGAAGGTYDGLKHRT